MDTIYNISLHILVIWWSLLMLIAIFIALKISFVIGSIKEIIDDMKGKYYMLFTPAKIIELLLKRKK